MNEAIKHRHDRAETLFRQAPVTAHDQILEAINDIDEILGPGYARDHPELIAACIQAVALDLGANVIARALDKCHWIKVEQTRKS